MYDEKSASLRTDHETCILASLRLAHPGFIKISHVFYQDKQKAVCKFYLQNQTRTDDQALTLSGIHSVCCFLANGS